MSISADDSVSHLGWLMTNKQLWVRINDHPRSGEGLSPIRVRDYCFPSAAAAAVSSVYYNL